LPLNSKSAELRYRPLQSFRTINVTVQKTESKGHVPINLCD